MLMLRVIPVLILFTPSFDSSSTCPSRCQCYGNPSEPLESVHLICKWDQLNTTNLASLWRPDVVRTLTIRCPHFPGNISSPPAGLFQGLRNLDRLEIDRCHFTGLPSAFFSGLRKLYSLIIKNAKLSNLPNDFFAHTPSLMTLDLTGNQLQIEPYSLRSLRKLIHLDLSNNSIGFFANTLVFLTKLKVLTMDHNRITNVDFRRLPQELTDLSLRHNFINAIYYGSEGNRNLIRIDLSGNQLDFLANSGEMNVLPVTLKQVDLSNNRIAFIQEGALAHMKALTMLDLRANRLTELRKDSVIGPETRLRLFLERNPFKCHCGLRWLIHATEKTSAVVLDLPKLSCSLLLDEDQTLNLTVADQLNRLLCKYDTLCPVPCACCDKPTCSCRSSCPPQCQCYRSANIDRLWNAQNVVVCQQLQANQLAEVPETLTELHIHAAEWKRWDIEKLQGLHLLKTLRISNTPITNDEVNSLSSLPSLMELELNSTTLTKVPSRIGRLSRLKLVGNPLSEITPDDVRMFDTLQRLSLGGNETRFTCDCEFPSPLQLWLQKQTNREKVEDVDSIMCRFHPLGAIPVISTLPGNGSVCQHKTTETTKWVVLRTNNQKQKNQNEMIFQGWKSSTPSVTILNPTTVKISEDQKLAVKSSISSSSSLLRRTQSYASTKNQRLKLNTYIPPQTSTDSSLRPSSTTPRYWRKYHGDNNQNQFLNALISVLFVCVLMLLMTIAFTLYCRFIRIEDVPKQRKIPPEVIPLHQHS